METNTVAHRFMPASPEAEKGLLGCIMLNSLEVLAMCDEAGVESAWFNLQAHAIIFTAMQQMRDAHAPIDVVTLPQWLFDRAQLEAAGGFAAVSELATHCPTWVNADYYIGILRDKWMLREVIRIGTTAAAGAYSDQDQPEEVVDSFERAAMGVRASLGGAQELVSPHQGAMEGIGAIESLYERRGALTGIPTGFHDLDVMTDGLQGANMYVIAARPSMGKTALMMNIAEHIAVDLKRPVMVYSLEMSRQQLIQRSLTSMAKVNMGRVRNGFLSERDFPALTVAASRMAESGLWIDDPSTLTIQAFRGKARRMKQRYGITAIFLDYLQLMSSATKRGRENRQQEVAEISGGLKAVAKELDIPIVVLAQLNRNAEGRTGEAKGKPRLSDLRESGSIEQDADFVGLLHREEYYATTDEEREKTAGRATLNVAKQRNGPVGDVALSFLKEFTRFETRANTTES